MKIKQRVLFPILIVTVLISAFWKLGTHEVMRYDEARNGVNALEMLQSGDYLNLYYSGKPDTWNAKPPLFIWGQVLSFRIFGKNNFALRFPAALASLFIFFFLFKIIILYREKYIAFVVCFILLAVKGVYGPHVARTGDFDALLTVFTTAGIYFFLKHIDFDKKKAIYWSAITFGLAFMTKGPAFGIVIPALLLYLIYRNKFTSILKSQNFYKATVLFIFFPLTWFLTIRFFGYHSEIVEYSANNSFDRLFLYDIFDRFFDKSAHLLEYQSRYDFFLVYLDTHFNLWNYPFIAGVLFGIFKMYKRQEIFAKDDDRLLILSIFIWLTMSLFLTFASTNHRWYMAPALPFIAYTTVHFVDWVCKKNSNFIYPLALLFLFTFIRHKIEYSNANLHTSIISENESLINSASHVYFVNTITPRQELIYELYIKSNRALFVQDIEEIKPPALCLSKLNYWQKIKSEQQNVLQLIREKDELVLFQLKE